MPIPTQTFRRRLLSLIALSWSLPPVVGFAFLGYLELFTPEQILAILASPLNLLFVLGAIPLCLWHFARLARPIGLCLDQPAACDSTRVARWMQRFSRHFWTLFLGYLLLAPAVTILSAEWHTDFVARPVDWFRIHLVALIVSILVGLPIFFAIFDLFGRAFGHIDLQRPVLSLRTRVFLIGALTPLLIDTMLVQYYWTRTGFFTHETFIVWLLLEGLAVGGALLFVNSLTRSLAPMQALIANPDVPRLPASTEEIGLFVRRLDRLLEEQALHRERLAFGNQLLRESRTLEGLGELLETIIERTRQALGCDMCFLTLYDPHQRELVGVIHTGAEYRPEGHYRIPVEARSLTARIFRTGRPYWTRDARNDPHANPRMVDRYRIRASAGVPLLVGQQAIGVLHAVHLQGPHDYSDRELRILDAFAQEAALAHTFLEDQRLRRRAETAIRQVNEAIANAIGSEFFPALARAMGEILDADGVAIAELSPTEPDHLETLAFWLDGESLPNQHYALAGTPCAEVLRRGHHCQFDQVQQRFPDARELAEMDIAVYHGIPLLGNGDKKLGVLMALYRNTPANPEFAASVMQLFAGRAAAEIERLRNEAKIRRMAYYDSLTGLPNRQLLTDRLDQALAHARRTGTAMAVILLDLDHFKDINDTLGHPVGDQLLQEVARRLTEAVRQEDTVARLGGDEFIILLTDIGPPVEAMRNATRAVEKIRRCLAPGYLLEGHSLLLTPSLGIAIHPEDGATAEQLIKHADTALYQAKGAGRDGYRFFSPAMNTAAVERLRLESELRKALEEERFELLLQPKVAIAGNRLIGAEVLLRWPHPELGDIPPGRFIPLAEETGLIVPLGNWVMAQACALTNRLWCQRGTCRSNPSLSFNVSPRQFSQPDFVERLARYLETHETRPECLELEITENLLIRDINDIERKLNALRELGVSLSIDDFGTGYSSLRYLQRLPIDTIKIDQAFVQRIATNRNDAIIVETIIAMARHLDLYTIAEGVETQAQLDILAARGCDAYQGFLFSPPQSLEEFQQHFDSA